MGQVFDEGGTGIAGQTVQGTSYSKWYEVGTDIGYTIDLKVDNLSGTDTPTHQWSVQDINNPEDRAEAVHTLYATNTFADVTAGPFPNTQQKRIIPPGGTSKKYIRVLWTLSGSDTVSTVTIGINKLKYGFF